MVITPTAEPGRHVSLGVWPTPVEQAPRLAAAIGLGIDDLWIKRDDLTGLGGGGNKVRKLEWTVGGAVADGADTLITTGAPQSNHARLTAAAGARLGLEVILVFPGSHGSAGSGNLALDGLLGARVAWVGDVDATGLAKAAADIAARVQAHGRRPALIPFGGSNVTGARGYLGCGRELQAQLPKIDNVVVALGSGGTMAGLVAALGPDVVLGIDTGARSDPLPAVSKFATGLMSKPLLTSDFRVRFDMVGSGYANLGEPVASAMSLAATTEGIILDPIYSGRAMAGLIAAVAEEQIKPGETTVFMHTGGLPGLFGHQDAIHRAESSLRGLDTLASDPR